MADPNKFKSVSVPIKTYKMLEFLGKGKLVDANLTISKTIEVLANKGVNSPDQIDSNLLETVMSILNKQDIELLIDKLKDNTVFKEVLGKVQEKYN